MVHGCDCSPMDGTQAAQVVLAEPQNHYVRAVHLSLDHFSANPKKRFQRAKHFEEAWGITRRVIARAWEMLKPMGVLEHRSGEGGANGHGGRVWEVHPEEARDILTLFEVLPFHTNATVYGALGYGQHGVAPPAPPTCPSPPVEVTPGRSENPL